MQDHKQISRDANKKICASECDRIVASNTRGQCYKAISDKIKDYLSISIESYFRAESASPISWTTEVRGSKLAIVNFYHKIFIP